MNIYIVMENYYNGCDSWESIFEAYKDEDDANIRCMYLNDGASTDTSWFVRTEELLEGVK